MQIRVETEYDNYIFTKKDNKIYINGKFYNLDIYKIEDDDIRKELIGYYEEYVSKNKSKKYSLIKAALFYAPYTECSIALAIEIMDLVVLYLMGVFEYKKIKKLMTIIITDYEIYSNYEKYPIEMLNSTVNDYDYESLFKKLIDDNNLN